ncbi:MAG: hypothetical protein HXY24_15155 [Rubrivivax sp.]|nr:hypothetical protein [Rubrivivax sp.]
MKSKLIIVMPAYNAATTFLSFLDRFVYPMEIVSDDQKFFSSKSVLLCIHPEARVWSSAQADKKKN